MQSIFPISPPGELGPVAAEVERELRGRLSEFRVSANGEGLVLSGSAPSFYVKQLAQHAIRRLTPLRIVRNDIEVICVGMSSQFLMEECRHVVSAAKSQK